MPLSHVTFDGLPEARAYFAKLKDGATAVGRLSVLVGSPVRYARYQELGTRYLRGRFYLTNALRAVQPRIKPAITAAVEKGPQAVYDAGLRLGYEVQRAAQATAPVRTGNLRRSIHTVAGARG